MPDRSIGWRPSFRAGATFLKRLVIPHTAGDPAGVVDNELWVDDTEGKLAVRIAGNTVLIPLPSELGGGGLSQEQIEDFMALMVQDNADMDWTYIDNGASPGALVGVVKPDAITYAKLQNASATARVLGRISAGAGDYEELTGANIRTILGVLDADTVGGLSAAGIQTAVVNTIVNGAGAAFDTLIEIQALLEGDDTAITGLTTAVGLRARFGSFAIPNGATPQTVNHGKALGAIGDFTYRTFVTATGVNEDYEVTPVDANNVSVSDESGAAIPAGRSIFMTFGA